MPHDACSSVEDLQAMSRAELEACFRHAGAVEPPSGLQRGHFLTWIDHREARRRRWRWPQRIAFEYTPFGIDFDRKLWFFFTPGLAAGRFDARVQASRWRDTRAVGLHYEPSRLPAPLRSLLYDEVKPLGEGLALGLGGINAGPGAGDHFFFALEPWRMEERTRSR